jgi:excisionase family DNA binding protein
MNINKEINMTTNYIDIKKASEYLSLAIQTLYCYVNKSKIPFIKVGDRVLFDVNDLDNWMSSKKQAVK